MSDKPDSAEFNMLQSMHLRLQPYQYFKVYIQSHRYAMENEPDKMLKLFSKPKEFVTQKAFVQTGEVALDIPELRILNIDKDVMPMLEDTTPDYSDLKMKYPAMFINQRIELGDTTINGFLLVDYEQIERDHPNIGWTRDEYGGESIRVLCIGINREHKFEFYSIHPVIKEESDKERIYIDDKEEKSVMAQLSRKVVALSCNLLNLLVNDEKEIEYVDVVISEEQNRKRAKRKKLPLMNTTTIRIGGSLKKYIEEYMHMRGTIGVRYHVGGFWRHYTSDFFKEMKGKKVWIYPHYRGMEHLPTRVKRFVNVKLGGQEGD